MSSTLKLPTFQQTTACSIANCCRRISPRLFILHSPSGRRRIVLNVYGLFLSLSVSRFEIVTQQGHCSIRRAFDRNQRRLCHHAFHSTTENSIGCRSSPTRVISCRVPQGRVYRRQFPSLHIVSRTRASEARRR